MDELLGGRYFTNPLYDTIEEYVDLYVGPVGDRMIEIYKTNVSAWSCIPRDKVIMVNDRKTRNAVLAAALRQESGGDWRRYVNGLFVGGETVANNDAH